MRRLIFGTAVACLLIGSMSAGVQEAAAAPPGVYLRYTQPEKGNSIVYAKNDTNKAVTVKYRRAVASAQGHSEEKTITVQAQSEVRLGDTCAFDVTYSTLCGSAVVYQLL
ncbi:hypothetical protein [Myxococcus xanthus]|uniref:hypothetical protein n=1 Tax=Myxococcus xanthus TaxID=34 RepID=UPI00112A36A2|nr:hypothetical protein [Myxococcus xanthus]